MLSTMRSNLSLALAALFSVTTISAAQQSPASNKCTHSFGDLYIAVKSVLFAVPDKDASTATLYFEPAWEHPESEIIIQFPKKGIPAITSFALAPGQKPISTTVSSAMKAGSCDAAIIARRVRVVKRSVPLNEHLNALVNRVWVLAIVPRPVQSVHVDTELHVLEVSGQDHVRFSSDDPGSPVALWMDEVSAAVDSSR
jgi:hypothetical protein